MHNGVRYKLTAHARKRFFERVKSFGIPSKGKLVGLCVDHPELRAVFAPSKSSKYDVVLVTVKGRRHKRRGVNDYL